MFSLKSIIRISSAVLLLLVTCKGNAQTSADVYRQPLDEIMKKVGKRFGVEFRYDADSFLKKKVEYAQWKLTSNLPATLDNILKPLDLKYRQVDSKTYVITWYEYYRRANEEAAIELNELLKAFPDSASFNRRKTELKSCIADALGINNFSNRTPLNPVLRQKKVFDGYTTENIAFESIPGYYVTGTLYRPVAKGNYAVILSPHGHFYNEQQPTLPKDSSRYRADMQYRCASLAKMGALVLSYDMYAWGESALMTGGGSYHETGFASAIQTWNSIRALDFMLSLPGADSKRVGVSGASGGGTQTFLLAALDDRVKVSAPVVMVGASFFGGCPCESGLPIHGECNGRSTNNTEIAAIIAPKPLLVVSDGDDWTKYVQGTDYPYLQKIYGFYGKQSNVESVYLPDERHDYGISKRIPVYHFFAKHLGLNEKAVFGKDGKPDESKITVLTNDDLRVFGPAQPLPANALRSHEAIVNAFKKVQEK
ncbi:MAG TPA: DUF4974 domain-containing protein [Chitinophagaceae bacterium]|nr:DUF4974 domain-containing protein [Chitinophagaceae bacterium]